MATVPSWEPRRRSVASSAVTDRATSLRAAGRAAGASASPPAERTASARAGHGGVGVQPADPALHAQQPRERPAVLLAEVRVARERLLARLAPVDDEPQLASAGEPEVQRGADPLGRGGQAVPRAVADEE